MRFLGGALVAGGLLTLCYLGILHGWRSRKHRQGAITPPPEPPADLDDSDAIEGVYVATTTAYDWLDRIAVHGLGVRSRADVVVAQAGVAILRTAAPSLYIPAEELLSVRTERGIAGKVAVESAGLVVFTWQHDGHRFDTGFRPRHRADVERLTLLAGELAMTVPGHEDDHDEAKHGYDDFDRGELQTNGANGDDR
ncbi:MAG TPA: hypothetical protein VFB74_07930 [Kribbellaceae bacterium]|nr:hypothetical protein [Kribbellaceae bacterium]